MLSVKHFIIVLRSAVVEPDDMIHCIGIILMSPIGLWPLFSIYSRFQKTLIADTILGCVRPDSPQITRRNRSTLQEWKVWANYHYKHFSPITINSTITYFINTCFAIGTNRKFVQQFFSAGFISLYRYSSDCTKVIAPPAHAREKFFPFIT